MSDRQEYNDEEWGTIIAAPVAVISAVIGASPSSPVRIMQEVGAVVKFFERAAEERRANPLITALLVTLKGKFETLMGGAGDPAVEQVDIIELGRDPERALAAVAAARELLAARAPAEAGNELRAWLYELAETVAHAAPEGGFFGVGGEQVDAAERTMLVRIAQALGVKIVGEDVS